MNSLANVLAGELAASCSRHRASKRKKTLSAAQAHPAASHGQRRLPPFTGQKHPKAPSSPRAMVQSGSRQAS
jgi:hypothetical protein